MMPPTQDATGHRREGSRLALQEELAAVLGPGPEPGWLVEEAGDAHEARWLAQRRRCGVPLQYLIGHWSFRHLDLLVDPRVLIPRPETEQVVEVALAMLDATVAASPRSAGPTVVDLGTGSGAIALSVATEARTRYPGLHVVATDVSPDALDVARANRLRVGAQTSQVQQAQQSSSVGAPSPTAHLPVVLRCGTWWDAVDPPLRGRVDLVVANPPYVSADEWVGLQPEVRAHEPRRALVAADGPEGTPGAADIAVVLGEATSWLAPGGCVVVEIAPHQAAAAVGYARGAGLQDVQIRPDLSGRQRMVTAFRA